MSTPTQVEHPWRATLRTVLAIAVGVLLAIASVVLFLAAFLPQLLEAVSDVLPPEWVAYFAAVIAWIAAIAGAVTRVMAIPVVNDWLTKHRLGASPKLDAGTAGTGPSKITSL